MLRKEVLHSCTKQEKEQDSNLSNMEVIEKHQLKGKWASPCPNKYKCPIEFVSHSLFPILNIQKGDTISGAIRFEKLRSIWRLC